MLSGKEIFSVLKHAYMLAHMMSIVIAFIHR